MHSQHAFFLGGGYYYYYVTCCCCDTKKLPNFTAMIWKSGLTSMEYLTFSLSGGVWFDLHVLEDGEVVEQKVERDVHSKSVVVHGGEDVAGVLGADTRVGNDRLGQVAVWKYPLLEIDKKCVFLFVLFYFTTCILYFTEVNSLFNFMAI